MHQIQRGTGDRVRQKRVNERTGDEVPFEDVVKGYPTEDGWVIVDPKDLDEIAPVYFRDTYYLAPSAPEYTKVYGLLREALATTYRAGIATFVMRNRQYLAAVKAEHEVLALHCARAGSDRMLWWSRYESGTHPHQTVGMVPPSMTCSAPAMEAARSDTRNATSSATSEG